MPLQPPLRQYWRSPVLRNCVRYLGDLSTLEFCSPQDKRSQRIRLRNEKYIFQLHYCFDDAHRLFKTVLTCFSDEKALDILKFSHLVCSNNSEISKSNKPLFLVRSKWNAFSLSVLKASTPLEGKKNLPTLNHWYLSPIYRVWKYSCSFYFPALLVEYLHSISTSVCVWTPKQIVCLNIIEVIYS